MNGKLASLAVQNALEMGWYVVNTLPRCEPKVAAAMTREKIEHWLPVETRRYLRKYTKGVYREVSHPLLTGYLFVRLPKKDANSYAIRAIDGVRDVLGRNVQTGKIIGISDAEIAKVLQLCADGLLSKPDTNRRPFKREQQVRVCAGPFVGLNATVDAYTPRESVRVLVSLFGRLASTEIALDDLEAV